MPDRSDISPLSITDGKISNEAKIAHAKLAKAVEGQILVAQSNGKFAAKSLAGDVTLDAAGNTTSNVAVSTDGTTVVTGATGAKGDKGDTGNQGATGPAGSDATVTTSAVDSAGAVMHTDITGTGLVKRTGSEAYSTSSTTDDLGEGSTNKYASSTNVNAAGAIMHTDVPDSDTGFVKRTGAETYDVDTATYSTTGHTHDDRYYTETESDTLLAAKAASSHSHSGSDITSGTVDTDRLDVGASSGKVAAGDHTHSSYITGNETITLSGDVSGSGTTAITCVVGNDSHTHSTSTLTGLGGAAEKDVGTGSGDVAQGNHTHDSRYFQESEFLNASAGAGDAGKPVKLDAGGHIDSTMINSGDVSFVDLDDLPSTFAPSSHNHAATDITSGTLDTARLDVGASSGKVAAGDHTHAAGTTSAAGFISTADKTKLDACLEVDDAGGSTTSNTWSASKIASNALYAAANFSPVSKYTAAIEWETDVSTIGFSGSSGSMVCTINHGLDTKYFTMTVRDKDDVIEDLGHVPIVTVIDDDNVKLEYFGTDYPAVGEDKFITIIG